MFFPLDRLPEPARYFALLLTYIVGINRAITLPAFSPTNHSNLAWIAMATTIFFALAPG